uniref:Lin-66-like winged helix domain-containing protein n=1 Tax=Caenorhabditis japonica TaxID=281687 RepID=A0A8R1I597_CAEJA
MAHQINGLFVNQPMRGGHHQPHQPTALFTNSDFPPIGGPATVNVTGNVLFMDRQLPPQFQAAGFNRPQMIPPPLLGQSQVALVLPEVKTTISGTGRLSWLSAKAGLITCDDGKTISFQIKDFCDSLLTDLTSVLRVGFDLKFSATLHETNDYTATSVSPTYGPEAELRFANSGEIDLEATCPTPANAKDAYSMVLENKAIAALLAAFQRHGSQKIQLSSLHSQMSNYGDDELYRYVGTSSMKRRQFVERRTHLFRLQNDDAIILQFPAIYQGVYLLASFLLRRGGATSIQSLFDFYMSVDVPQEIRDHNGIRRQEFLNLLTAHTWVFALFPNRTFVSVRRNLPNYDYVGFVKQFFPELELNRQQIMYNQGIVQGMPQNMHQAMGQTIGGMGSSLGQVQRTMSVPMNGGATGYGAAGPRGPNMYMPQQQPIHHHQHPQQQQQQMQMHPNSQISRPMSLWGSQSSLNRVDAEVDQLFPAPHSTWSNTPVSNSRASNINTFGSSVNETLFSNSSINNLLSGSGSHQAVKTMASIGVQADESMLRAPINAIGQSVCTCQCTCGRGGTAVIGTTIGSRSSGSASPRSIDGHSQSEMSPSNVIGSIGGPSFSLNIAPDHQPVGSATGAQNFYDLFGASDFLNGTGMSSLRIN